MTTPRFPRLLIVSAVAWLLATLHPVQAQNTKFGYPAFDIMLTDSTTIFNTGKADTSRPIALLFFSTTCDHCQNLAKQLVSSKNELLKISLVMISIDPLSAIKQFYKNYSLSQLTGLTIGRDIKFTGPRYYAFESFPFCALYTKKKKFIKAFERDFTPASITGALK